MLTKEQIEEWEASEEYYSPSPKESLRKAVKKAQAAGQRGFTPDPYDDAPVVDDAYKQDFSIKFGNNSFQRVSDMVEDFAKVTGQETNSDTYVNLIFEEFNEWEDEIDKYRTYSTEAELKELCDLVYVIYGYARAKGWDLDVAVQRVHNNNLARVVQPDGSIKRREDGKILKRENAPKVYLKDLV